MKLKGEINVAPYSFFNSISSDPPMVMFASDGRKDTVAFIGETKECVCGDIVTTAGNTHNPCKQRRRP
jgi:flavin reductase (DIM6/NTAB) family NADH-FMN oxidoreductase RutF